MNGARAGDLIVGTPFHWGLLAEVRARLPDGVFGATSAGPSTAQTWAGCRTIGLTRLTEVYGATETGGIATRAAWGAPFAMLGDLRRVADAIVAPDRRPEALDVQDRLDWVGDDLFHILGRKDDVVQVAGVNVCPAAVRAAILSFDGVGDVAVRPGSERIKAYVVPKTTAADPAAFEQALRHHILHSLAAPARPGSLTFGPSLPRNAIGKLCDWQVAAPNG